MKQVKERISAFRDRMDRTAEKMAAFQAKLFLNLFYVTVVPLAHAWLRVTGNIHHRTTGYFQETDKHAAEIERHQKQH
ncbi:MAG: hypothetical protein SVW02_02370 [Candidatus Nanohaloarchaea archaeon]|nr:hypothetical protein [Candidatus Nanohaloarchaea archaeon]